MHREVPLRAHWASSVSSVPGSSSTCPAGMQAFLDGIGNALAAQSTAAQKCEALAQLPSAGIPEPVSRAATELLQREAASRVGGPPFLPSARPLPQCGGA